MNQRMSKWAIFITVFLSVTGSALVGSLIKEHRAREQTRARMEAEQRLNMPPGSLIPPSQRTFRYPGEKRV